MAVKVVTSWVTLIRLARAEAEAVKIGDEEWLKKVKEAHENYRQLCLEADGMIIPQVDPRGPNND